MRNGSLTALVIASLMMAVWGYSYPSVLPSSGATTQDGTPGLRMSPRELATSNAMSDYMAKAHEEKLRAIQDVERRKNAEIAALQQELAELKKAAASKPLPASSVSPPPAKMHSSVPHLTPSGQVDVAAMTKQELADRLLQYMQYMAKYLISAQEQKFKAIKAAEAAVYAKFEEKSKGQQAPRVTATHAAAPAVAAATPSAPASSLYAARNSAVAAAAAAGKQSRWGHQEIQRINGLNGSVAPSSAPSSTTATSSAAAQSPLFTARNAAVAAAAAAGKQSRWGPQEVQRISGVNGVVTPVANAAAAIVSAAVSSHYAARNAVVAAAAVAGKQSRWGQEEVQRINGVNGAQQAGSINGYITNGVNGAANGFNGAAANGYNNGAPINGIPTPPEVIAADHGLRADGGVGGLTLAERVAFGAAANGFNGAMNGGAAANGAAVANVPIPPEVIAADHGLRADGGVDGLTLAERVAMGASASLQSIANGSSPPSVPLPPPAPPSVQPPPQQQHLYQQRNAALLAAVQSGRQSRWGMQEVQRIQSLSTSTPPSANGAARASSGLTVEERVNVGARLLRR
jgi:hypothetical protein